MNNEPPPFPAFRKRGQRSATAFSLSSSTGDSSRRPRVFLEEENPQEAEESQENRPMMKFDEPLPVPRLASNGSLDFPIVIDEAEEIVEGQPDEEIFVVYGPGQTKEKIEQNMEEEEEVWEIPKPLKTMEEILVSAAPGNPQAEENPSARLFSLDSSIGGLEFSLLGLNCSIEVEMKEIAAAHEERKILEEIQRTAQTWEIQWKTAKIQQERIFTAIEREYKKFQQERQSIIREHWADWFEEFSLPGLAPPLEGGGVDEFGRDLEELRQSHKGDRKIIRQKFFNSPFSSGDFDIFLTTGLRENFSREMKILKEKEKETMKITRIEYQTRLDEIESWKNQSPAAFQSISDFLPSLLAPFVRLLVMEWIFLTEDDQPLMDNFPTSLASLSSSLLSQSAFPVFLDFLQFGLLPDSEFPQAKIARGAQAALEGLGEEEKQQISKRLDSILLAGWETFWSSENSRLAPLLCLPASPGPPSALLDGLAFLVSQAWQKMRQFLAWRSPQLNNAISSAFSSFILPLLRLLALHSHSSLLFLFRLFHSEFPPALLERPPFSSFLPLFDYFSSLPVDRPLSSIDFHVFLEILGKAGNKGF